MLQLWATGDWQLHHNNAPAHASRLLQNFLAKHQVTHPGGSAPLEPRFGALQLLVYPKTKITFKREEFQTINEIQENTMEQLMDIRRTM